ncbi:MAG: hypothetical protein WBE83_09210, partial [Candidatus Cybelea sp.]
AYRVRRSTNTDTPLPPEEPAGQNPPDGAIVDYALASTANRVVLSFYDTEGRLERRFSSDDAAPAPIPNLDKPTYWERPFVRPATSAGMHRFVWDLRETPPRSTAQDLPISAVPHDTPRTPEGLLVPPGTYVVRLSVDGKLSEQRLVVLMDPRVSISREALATQYALSRRLESLMNRSFADQERVRKSEKPPYESINESAAFLLDAVDGSDSAPTAQAAEAIATLEGRLTALERARSSP